MKQTEKKARGKTNPYTLEQVKTLNKSKAKAWKDLAKRITKPTRQTPSVPIWRISKHTKEGETVIIPGKVLGNGNMAHKITISALSYTKTAEKKLKEAKCKTATVEELVKNNPKATGIRIME